MHKRTNKSSSLFDEDDEDEEIFGRNSNRFLKTKVQPKNDFQRELESKVALNRSISPKSVDTDSELVESNHENSFKNLGNSKNQRTTLGSSNWQPNLEKSPRMSLKNDESKLSNFPSEKSNQKSKSSSLSKQKSIFDENSDDLESPRQPINRFSKSPRDEKSGFGKEFSSNDNNSKQGDYKNRFLKTDFSEKKKDAYDENDSLSKTIRFKDSEKVSQLFDDINKSEKSNKTRNNFEINDEDSFNSNPSRFLKTQKTKTTEDKSNKSEFGSFSKSKNKFDIDEKKKDTHDENGSFSKTIRFKDSEKDSQIFDNSNKFEKNNITQKNFGMNDEEDSVNINSSRFLKTRKTKTTDDKSNKSEFGSFSKSKNKFDIDDSDNDLNSTASKESKGERDKLNSRELEGSSKFIPNNSKNKFNFPDDLDMELNNSTKYIRLDQTNNDEKFKSDIKPKPRKSQIKNSENENEQFLLKNNKDNKFNFTQDDHKIKKSIRFEDEIFDPYTKNSKTSSRESSPRKSDISRESSRKNSPSPQTSICEEVIHDPFTHKNETIKKKLEEEKREKESKFESPQNKLINLSINSVADCQNEVESKPPQPSLKKTTTRPTSAKYRNVQPKITTRINLKSARPLSINNEWLSSPNLNSDSDNINSERPFTDSQIIRETAYLQWYLAKLSEKNSKKSIDNTEEKKKTSSDEERIAAYEAWKKAKHDHFKELDRKRKEEIKKNEKSETPENKENKSAEIAFEVWKKQKEESLKEELKIKTKEEKQKKLKLTKEYQEKDSKRATLLNDWKQRKDKELQDKKLQTQKEEQEKAEKENESKNKLVNAEKAYKEWEEKTDKKIKKYCEYEKSQAELINNRRAWRPSNNAIVKTRRI